MNEIVNEIRFLRQQQARIQKYTAWAKSAAIIGLAGLAILLTVQLWLVSIPNRSFFPYIGARLTSAPPDGAFNLVRPFRVISGTGDGFFDIAYSNIGRSDFWEYGQAVITALLQGSGTFVSRTDINMAAILDGPVLIFEYAFDMDAAVFAHAFDQRAGVLTGGGVDYFQAVAMTLPANTESPLSVYFVTQTHMWQFTLTAGGRRADPIFDGILMPPPLNPYRRFVAADTPLIFTPYFHENFSYHPLVAVNPYENHSGVLGMAFIHRQVEHFFANPATINQQVDNAIYTFRNLNTVVQYLPWDVVEYTSFRTIGRGTPNFIADFSAAWAFVDGDLNMTNDFYLAGYDNTRGRENIFWFNFVVSDFPLRLQGQWYAHPGDTNPLAFPIEVVVENGRVLHYRKIPFVFTPDTGITARLLPSTGAGERPIGFVIEQGLRSGQDLYLQGLH